MPILPTLSAFYCFDDAIDLKRQEALASNERTPACDPIFAVALVSKAKTLRALAWAAEVDTAPLRPEQVALDGQQATQSFTSSSYKPLARVAPSTTCKIRRCVTALKDDRLPSRRLDTY
jgi:hypothetical protein